VIAIFCGALESGRQPTIYGDGTQTRDYVYVGDVVAADIAAAEANASGPVNIGTSSETSVLELVDHLAALGGKGEFTPALAPARLGELARSCLDISRARELFDWEPRVGLREGLRLTLDANRTQR
jgi:UDP-glucose 4-epimerase